MPDFTAIDDFESGGWVLLSILAVSLVAWVLLVFQWLKLREESRAGDAWVDAALGELRQGNTGAVTTLCEAHDTVLGRVLLAALRASGPDRRFFRRQMRPIVDGEATALRRHLLLIGVLCSLLPLLGLLGTVLGMLKTFSALSYGESVRVGAVADGVSQALITTQAGLLAAVPILLLNAWLSQRVEQSVREATLCGNKVETILWER